MTVLPGQLIVGGRILVGLLFFHDETHVLIGLAARLQGKPVSMSAPKQPPWSSEWDQEGQRGWEGEWQ